MNKFSGTFLVIFAGGVSVYLIAWLAGYFFGPLYYGEDEATRNFKIFLFLFVTGVIGAGILGYRQTKNKI